MELRVRGAAVVGRGDDVTRVGGGRYLIYSVTKTYLAVLALRLGLPLDEQVEGPWTLRQLLNHTSGVPSYTDWPEYEAAVSARPGEAWSDEEFLERAHAVAPRSGSG